MLQIEFCVVLILGFTVFESHSLQCWTCSSDIDPTCRDRFNATDFRYGGFQQAGYSGFNQPPYDPYNQPRPYDRNRDLNRDNPAYDRDHHARDPLNNNRDYNNRDYNRDNNNNRDYNQNNRDPNYYRDSNRDPYFNRDPNNPNNRDYPQSSRDYNRDYQGRNYDPNYPARDPQQQQYPRSQAQLSAAGPKLQVCNEDDAQTRHVRTVCIKKVQRYNEYQVTYIRRCEVIPYDKEIGTCHDAVARGISLDFCEYCDYDGCNSATSQKFNIFLISFLTLTLFWRYFS